ncbi:hypothetical protein U1Q18_031082, partial [Sarracenia purpurea var. burkii]
FTHIKANSSYEVYIDKDGAICKSDIESLCLYRDLISDFELLNSSRSKEADEVINPSKLLWDRALRNPFWLTLRAFLRIGFEGTRSGRRRRQCEAWKRRDRRRRTQNPSSCRLKQAVNPSSRRLKQAANHSSRRLKHAANSGIVFEMSCGRDGVYRVYRCCKSETEISI